ncbi:MAG: DUF3732 domain-containing protein [Clostridium sp.]|nr:DUF3732 domain-containing protein [Clostridium sp.]MCM1460579.1 DUF3732 domain-containing protein [Bacteroides sp.]
MNFYIDKMILWLKNGEKRIMKFEQDKINIITGNSRTGKTAILEIIDYCFCGSEDTVVIPDECIGENVLWYGVRFGINDKMYTVARGEKDEKTGDFSEDYYFSQTGEIPEIPIVKMKEKELKLILETEFQIDDKIILPYGGKGVRKNVKLSFRYFLVYNTISNNIIDNGKLFFDKMTLDRYKTVWNHTFDLAFNVVSFEYFELQNEIEQKRYEINRLESEFNTYQRKKEKYNYKREILVKHAKEAMVISESLEFEEAFEQIERLILEGANELSAEFSVQQKYIELEEKRNSLNLQITRLKRFKESYGLYKKRIQMEAESLSPVSYVLNNYGQNVEGEYLQFLQILDKQLNKVKSEIGTKRPFEYDVSRKINELKEKIKEIDEKLSRTAKVDYYAIPTAQKLLSLGELKAEYKELKFEPINEIKKQQEIDEKKKALDELLENEKDVEERRQLIIDTLNEYIQTYVEVSSKSLGEYGEYFARFDYKRQRLNLKKDKEARIAQISSSSDHLFMQLCLFAGMHQMLLKDKSKFVPSYLIIDQPSHPYFNNSEYDYSESRESISEKDDWYKVRNIFAMWDVFMKRLLEQRQHFQLIILEHVSEEAWKDCENVHLVATFDGKNDALIPLELCEKKTKEL